LKKKYRKTEPVGSRVTHALALHAETFSKNAIHALFQNLAGRRRPAVPFLENLYTSGTNNVRIGVPRFGQRNHV
jgi:hypothetical protein